MNRIEISDIRCVTVCGLWFMVRGLARASFEALPCALANLCESVFHRARFIICLLPFALCLLFSSASASPTELFTQANQLYKDKNYEGAIVLYDSIAKSGYISAELFFNLGNAHFKLGHLAPAILNYERANKLNPSDQDIDFNLKLANLRVVDRVEPVPELFFVKWIKNLVIGHSSDGWAKLAAILIWASFLFAILFLFINNGITKRVAFFAALLALLLSMAAAGLSFSQYKYQRASRTAILFAKNAYVKSAPDQQSTDLFLLREGIRVTLLKSEGEWQQIQLADGKVGWMKKEGLEVI